VLCRVEGSDINLVPEIGEFMNVLVVNAGSSSLKFQVIATPDIQRRYKPGIPYALFQPRYRLDREHLLDGDHSTTLAETIAELVRAEGPIHHDLLLDRLKELHGVARGGSNVQSNIERALRRAQQSRGITREPRSPFYFLTGQDLEFFRVPAASRPRKFVGPASPQSALFCFNEAAAWYTESACWRPPSRSTRRRRSRVRR
jgi:hypothetical protein